MKTCIQKTLLILTLFLVGSTFAQQEKGIIGSENWLSHWTDFKPKSNDYSEPTQILSGNISKDTKLSKKETYLLMGTVFVTGSSTLTIEPGTVIMGDSDSNGSLVITRGSKLMAEGLDTDPIIFTSSKGFKKSGDWGGLFILGEAPINQVGGLATLNIGNKRFTAQNPLYGGHNPKSFSGSIKYVRIEYAGKRTKEGYLNGLTLAGVGSETILENIMVSYCKGNSFDIKGGVVNIKKAVSFRTNSSDYKFNYGAQALLSNSLAIRSPYMSGSSESSGLYVASFNRKEEVNFSKKPTSVVAENLSLINLSDHLKEDIEVGLVKEGVYLAQGAHLDMKKSIISGFNPAVILDNQIVLNDENLDNIKFSEIYFNNSNGNIFMKDTPNNEDLENWYGNTTFSNVYSNGLDSETFINYQDMNGPDFRLNIHKIVAARL